jgi:pectate lyase
MLMIACVVLAAIPLATAADALPAFPGAEGYGKHAKGGRGGRVIYVTTLEDSGPGSLRSALEASGPRNVLFKVSGTITLKSPIIVDSPYLTIAGQTAPGDGIAVRTTGFGASGNTINTISVRTHDVVIRYLRVRPASTVAFVKEDNISASWMDAIGFWGPEAHDCIVDHVSTSWGCKDEMQAWDGAHDITIQHCILAEGLTPNRHSKGSLVGGGSDRVTFYGNLFAHNEGRNPYIKASDTRDHVATFQVVNNAIYDWGRYGTEVGCDDSLYWSPDPGVTRANVIANYYRPGPSTDPRVYEILACIKGKVKLYLSGNIGPHRPAEAQEEWDLVGLRWVGRDEEASYGTPAEADVFRADRPFDAPALPVVSAQQAYEEVLRNVGATRPRRDAADQRVIAEVRRGTGRIIANPSEVGGWPELPEVHRPEDYDTDGDGLPDAWELARFGTLARDGRGDANSDGYTDLEDFLNEGLPSGGWR